MTLTVEDAAELLDVEWFDYQVDCFTTWQGEALGYDGTPLQRMCVVFPTGKGKTLTTLMCLALRGAKEAVVVAPPVTHEKWVADGARLGIEVEAMSHARFRMKQTKLSRHKPIIVDEFHMLGGQTGAGWKKFDTQARHMQAPVLFCSATPNYNDAERVYCVAHVLDPLGNRGGYIAWLYEHCLTEPNLFGTTPIVTGFRNYASAEAFLEAMPGVVFVEDDAPDILKDLPVVSTLPPAFAELGYDESRGRLMASQMEERHRERYLQVVDHVTGRVHGHVYDLLATIAGNAPTPLLVFAEHSTIASALAKSLHHHQVSYGYVDGKSSEKEKSSVVQSFRDGQLEVLVGTATLATGTDGLDKMCDAMVILDDTSDRSLRRQLVGRILPRGTATPDYSKKVANRFVYFS